jgi:hypothetical protein
VTIWRLRPLIRFPASYPHGPTRCAGPAGCLAPRKQRLDHRPFHIGQITCVFVACSVMSATGEFGPGHGIAPLGPHPLRAARRSVVAPDRSIGGCSACEVYVPISCQLRTSPPTPSASGVGYKGLYPIYKIGPWVRFQVFCQMHRASRAMYRVTRLLHHASRPLQNVLRGLHRVFGPMADVRWTAHRVLCTASRAARFSAFRGTVAFTIHWSGCGTWS